MTSTPRERADVACDNWRKDIHAHWTLPMHVEHAIKEAISDQTAALQAALEDLAKANSALTSEQIAHGKTMQERDEYALAVRLTCPKCRGDGWVGEEDAGGYPSAEYCPQCKGVRHHLAAHDRAVAVRALRGLVDGAWRGDQGVQRILDVAAEYERGEREVPSE
jgi:predicted Zn-ribbon and HTH transcriptional regulator